ncbi:histidine kinase [Pseudoprimorskyibacter insulae]|uniref:HPt domain-containing protein n=1 Tax=Pseudoprimorskyibacter insulae TaxID=1695997 RepID=A0A2R8ATH5_9RHOB|nr:histidine kinase [Pseudoprimorskyibacter insulae]SPF79351.1 hypothetical protein PRI8871_01146 [Pseudoprimorskyibacter insulae]
MAIDWMRVRELYEEIGPNDFDEVVDLFLVETSQLLADYRSASVAEIPAALHALRGSAMNLGFRDFVALCAEGSAPEEAELQDCFETSCQVFREQFSCALSGAAQTSL